MTHIKALGKLQSWPTWVF